MKHDNEQTKFSNLRQFAYDTAWKHPLCVKTDEFAPSHAESRPRAFVPAQNRLITELSAYSRADVEADEAGNFTYSFSELEYEKKALEKYRSTTIAEAKGLGSVVFDTHSSAAEN